jgi:hypothetical protein
MGVVYQGLDLVLGSTFPTTPNKWYIGLINNAPTPVQSPSDTLGSHPGWVEAPGGGTNYSGNRPLWTNGTPAGQQVTNASYISFAITTTATLFGIFLCDQATGTTANLFGTAPFVGGPQAVVAGDTLQVTLTCSATSS